MRIVHHLHTFLILLALCLSVQAAIGQEALVTPIPAKGWVYDPVTKRIYATVGSNGMGDLGNSVSVINPRNGLVEKSAFVGSDPSRIVLSEGGKYLYVQLGDNLIRKVSLPALEPGQQFSIGGGLAVTAMCAAPGRPDGLIVLRYQPGISPSDSGLALYMNGTQSGRAVPAGHSLAQGLHPNRLYGYENQISSWHFSTLHLNSEELTRLSYTGSFIIHNTSLTSSGNGLLLEGYNNVRDPECRQTAGSIPITHREGAVMLDAITGRAHHVYKANGGYSVDSYSLKNFVKAGQVAYATPLSNGQASHLSRCGDDALAFLTGDRLVILKGTFGTKLASVDLALTRKEMPETAESGGEIGYKLSVANRGMAPATGIVISDHIQGKATVTTIKPSKGNASVTDQIIRAEVGELKPGESVTIDIKLRPTSAEALRLSGMVRAFEPDTNPLNNISLVLPKALPVSTDGADLTGALQGVLQESKGAGVNLKTTLSAVCNLLNAGNRASEPCVVRFYLSDFPQFRTDASQLIFEAKIPKLEPSGTHQVPLIAPLGSEDATGRYLFVVIDPGSAISDAKRDNNVIRAKVP